MVDISQDCMEEQWWEQRSGKDVPFISIYCFLDWWRQVTPSFNWLCLYSVLQSSVFILWASYTLHFYLVGKVTITGKICKVLCDLFRARTRKMYITVSFGGCMLTSALMKSLIRKFYFIFQPPCQNKFWAVWQDSKSARALKWMFSLKWKHQKQQSLNF